MLDTDWCHFAVLNSAFPILPSSSSVSGASLVPMKTIFVPISAPPSLANAETQGSCTKPNQTLQIRPTIQIFDYFFNFFFIFSPLFAFCWRFFFAPWWKMRITKRREARCHFVAGFVSPAPFGKREQRHLRALQMLFVLPPGTGTGLKSAGDGQETENSSCLLLFREQRSRMQFLKKKKGKVQELSG